MDGVPLIGRLSLTEYIALIFGFLFLAFEAVLRVIVVGVLPKSVVSWFYDRSRAMFDSWCRVGEREKGDGYEEEKEKVDKIRLASDFGELCRLWGYTYEEHVVLTKDGYLLGVHRLPSKKGEKRARPRTVVGKPVVYLHHGLLMNSEVWVCLTDEDRCLPFVLVERGFDVWLGNNRGNKYSKKCLHRNPNSTQFWDFSLDDYAWHDIPDTIHYILDTTKAASLGYVGFSQGTAQAFAALSIHPRLNEKVNVFVALAPAMTPPGLAPSVVDGLIKSSPTLIFLFFGRKSILSSTIFWRNLLYAPIYTKVIDASMGWLFGWDGKNIWPDQKMAAYSHLYSFASVKAVVHWFQIMRNEAFIMYDDDASVAPSFPSSRYHQEQEERRPGSPNTPPSRRLSSYRPARFPTRNIGTPIVLMYGDRDGLVDVNVLKRELPEVGVEWVRLKGYEHLDVLWGSGVGRDVVPKVVEALERWREEDGELVNVKRR